MAMPSLRCMAVGLNLLFQVAHGLIDIRGGLARLHHQGDAVDAGGDVLDVDVIALQHLQNAADDAQLTEDIPFLVRVMTEKPFLPAMPVIMLPVSMSA